MSYFEERIDLLETENDELRQRIAELEQKLEIYEYTFTRLGWKFPKERRSE